MERYLKGHGIARETTAPYSPEQNSVSGRANRTIMERVKAIIAETGLPKTLWIEIVGTVVYLKNISPTRTLKHKTLYEASYGRKPDLSHLRIIGSTAYIHIQKEKGIKLDFYINKCMLVGYAGTNYRLYDPKKNQVIISRDVVFKEPKFDSVRILIT